MRKDFESSTPEAEDEKDSFKVLSHKEAVIWRESQVRVSVWQVLALQAAAVVLLVLLSLGVFPGTHEAISVAYGGLSVVLPAVVMARGMTMGSKGLLGRWVKQGSFAAVVFWEAIKVSLTVILLLMAPVWLSEVNWLALVVGLVVVLKVYWLAFLMLSRGKKQSVVI